MTHSLFTFLAFWSFMNILSKCFNNNCYFPCPRVSSHLEQSRSDIWDVKRNIYIFFSFLTVTDSHLVLPKLFRELQPAPMEDQSGFTEEEHRGEPHESDENELSGLFVKKSPLVKPPNKNSNQRFHGEDCWHLVKNLTKALVAAGNKKNAQIILKW